MFVNGEEMSSLEDVRKWTTDDVYNFIREIPSCSEYAQVITNAVMLIMITLLHT